MKTFVKKTLDCSVMLSTHKMVGRKGKKKCAKCGMKLGWATIRKCEGKRAELAPKKKLKCSTKKQVFKSENAARRSAKFMNKCKSRLLHVYRCEKCNFWHHTSGLPWWAKKKVFKI